MPAAKIFQAKEMSSAWIQWVGWLQRLAGYFVVKPTVLIKKRQETEKDKAFCKSTSKLVFVKKKKNKTLYSYFSHLYFLSFSTSHNMSISANTRFGFMLPELPALRSRKQDCHICQISSHTPTVSDNIMYFPSHASNNRTLHIPLPASGHTPKRGCTPLNKGCPGSLLGWPRASVECSVCLSTPCDWRLQALSPHEHTLTSGGQVAAARHGSLLVKHLMCTWHFISSSKKIRSFQ